MNRSSAARAATRAAVFPASTISSLPASTTTSAMALPCSLKSSAGHPFPTASFVTSFESMPCKNATRSLPVTCRRLHHAQSTTPARVRSAAYSAAGSPKRAAVGTPSTSTSVAPRLCNDIVRSLMALSIPRSNERAMTRRSLRPRPPPVRGREVRTELQCHFAVARALAPGTGERPAVETTAHDRAFPVETEGQSILVRDGAMDRECDRARLVELVRPAAEPTILVRTTREHGRHARGSAWNVAFCRHRITAPPRAARSCAPRSHSGCASG